MIYSKVLELNDYNYIDTKPFVDTALLFQQNNVGHFNQHEHRMWEYGMALAAIKSLKKKNPTILDVGGGNSIFTPTLLRLGYNIFQVDPDIKYNWLSDQSKIIGLEIPNSRQDFFDYKSNPTDVVVCLSVIEHVENDRDFLLKLAQTVDTKGLLIITTDFHPSGQARLPWHIRSYNEKMLLDFANLLPDFKFLGSQPKYKNYTEQVNNYTFATLMLTKVEGK